MSLLRQILNKFRKEKVIIPYHYDLGHGWFEATEKLVKSLGIYLSITGYSRRDKKNMYLEEDVDAGLLLIGLKAKRIPYQIVRVDDGIDSFIKNLPRVRDFVGG